MEAVFLSQLACYSCKPANTRFTNAVGCAVRGAFRPSQRWDWLAVAQEGGRVPRGRNFPSPSQQQLADLSSGGRVAGGTHPQQPNATSAIWFQSKLWKKGTLGRSPCITSHGHHSAVRTRGCVIP